MEEFEMDNLLDKQYGIQEEQVSKNEIDSIISNLQLYSSNIEMLTKLYTDILMDDNVVYIMTRVSQNRIFMEHFPEFYIKNKNGESVINCQQNSKYHRYGVFKHILYTIENVGKDSLKFSTHDMKLLKWTMLLHDIGKPMAKTINSEGNDSFAGHDDISVELAKDILSRFNFNEQDKKIILTLIKYHDRYLNEGELTYDNLSFLAQELENEKDLFYLLIEVKLADNKAKSIDVYNKFKIVVSKYYDFANEYFFDEQDAEPFEKEICKDVVEHSKEDINIDMNIETITSLHTPNERGIYSEGGSDEDITEKIIADLSKEITMGRNFESYYQPIVDLKNKVVNGYEIYYKIITDEDFSYKQIMRKAKEYGKYDKIQQMLFVNALERFLKIKGRTDVIAYINIDIKSYKSYVNKARIFDIIDKNKVVFEFNNFESLINSDIKELSQEIQVRKGNVAIDKFESSNKTIRDLEQIEPKYIKFKIEDVAENTEKSLKELVTYCVSNSINIIAFGIDDKDKMDFAVRCGIRYVQGDLFGKPTDGLDLENIELEKILTGKEEELIV